MKKKLFTVAVAVAALCGIPAIAQNTNTANKDNGSCTCTPAEHCDSVDCRYNRPAKGQRTRVRNPYQEIFAGLNLTPEQQAAIDSIKPARPDRRQRNDSTATRYDPRQARRDYLNNVKQVLTPEQYVIFLENVVVEQGGPGAKGPRENMRQKNIRRENRQDRDARRGERRNARANRPGAAATQQQTQK